MRSRMVYGLAAALLAACVGCGESSNSEAAIRRRAELAAQAGKRSGDSDPIPPAASTAAASPIPPAITAEPPSVPAPANAPTPGPNSVPPSISPAVNAPGPPAIQPVLVANAPPAEALDSEARRARSIENLQKIGKALEAYCAAHDGSLPLRRLRDEDGKSLLSWRVSLLPYLGYETLYKQFHLNESWNSGHNRKLLTQIPPEFQSPERFDDSTNYLLVEGPGLASFDRNFFPLKPDNFDDGPDNTIVLVEANEASAVPWTSPQDLIVDINQPVAGVGSLREDGFFALLGDWQVKRIPKLLPPECVAALFTVAGEENLGVAGMVAAATAEVEQIIEAPPTETPDSATENPVETRIASVPATPGSAAAVATANLRVLPTPESRPPIPSKEEIENSRESLREIYKSEYEDMRKLEDRPRLAQKMLADAPQVEANAADYYELLRIARDLAASAGDAKTALSAVSLLSARFNINELEMRAKVLEDALKLPRAQQGSTDLTRDADTLLQDAYDANDFAVALRAADLLVGFARNKNDKRAAGHLAAQKQAVEAAKVAYARVPEAQATLRSNPSDPAANELVGKYLCLVKAQWPDGLPLLASGADIQFKVLAGIDLDPAKTPQQMLELGDQYWNLAEDHKQPQKFGLQVRAAHYYQLAAAGLTGSLDKVRAQKRHKEVVDSYSKEALDRTLFASLPAAPVQFSDE